MYSGKSATWIELNSYEPVNITTNTTGDKLVNDTATNNKDFAIFIGSKTASNAPFSISKSGSIKAKKGSIGGWTLADNYLIADSQKVGMMASGTYRFWAGATYNITSKTLDTSGTSYFYVNSSG
jgi:hypothetical protein